MHHFAKYVYSPLQTRLSNGERISLLWRTKGGLRSVRAQVLTKAPDRRRKYELHLATIQARERCKDWQAKQLKRHSSVQIVRPQNWAAAYRQLTPKPIHKIESGDTI